MCSYGFFFENSTKGVSILDFNYHNPYQVVYGLDGLSEGDKLVPREAKVMVVFDGTSAKKFEAVNRDKKALGSSITIELSGIEPNPKFEPLKQATE